MFERSKAFEASERSIAASIAYSGGGTMSEWTASGEGERELLKLIMESEMHN
jgi:hypothetical protein